MTKLLPLVIAFIIPVAGVGQRASHSKYDWEKNPGIYLPDSTDLQEDAVILYEKHHHEFISGRSGVMRLELMHVRKYLNTDAGIENNNRFYVNTNGAKVFKLKARVIQPSGKVIELNQSSIIESRDENRDVRYHYFALEGIEKGSVVEYLHYLGYEADPETIDYYFFSHFFDVDGSMIKKALDLTLQCDNALQIWSKSMNGAPLMSNRDLSDFPNYLSIIAYNIGKSLPEAYAYEADSKKRIYYMVNQAPRLSQTQGDPYFKMPSTYYTRLSRYLYNTVYFEMSRENYLQIKELNDFVGTAINKAYSNEDNIKAIENSIKENFVADSEASLDLRKILASKKVSKIGSLKLMAYAAKSIGIESQLVLSCDREHHHFPDSALFQSEIFLQDIFLYFPGLGIYYQAEPSTQIAAAPLQHLGNNGLFVYPYSAKANSYSTGIYDIQRIEAPPASYSKDILITTVSLDTTSVISTLKFDRSVSGYFAEPYRGKINTLNKPEQKDLEEGYFSDLITPIGEIVQYTFETDSTEIKYAEPIVGHAIIRSPYLATELDNKLLINLGNLIGRHPDLHGENTLSRKFPAHISHPCEYHRSIEFEIPEGYTVVNLSDFNISIKYEFYETGVSRNRDTFHLEKSIVRYDAFKTAISQVPAPRLSESITTTFSFDKSSTPTSTAIRSLGDKLSFGFTSNSTIVGSKIIITVNEWYEPVIYSREQYPDFVNVMNAAADFSSLVLVLEKK
jgi:hypothetical protein